MTMMHSLPQSFPYHFMFPVAAMFVFLFFFKAKWKRVSLILIFGCIKSILNALFSRFCLSEIIVRPFLSLVTKSEVYNVLASKLEQKDIVRGEHNS